LNELNDIIIFQSFRLVTTTAGA